MQLKDREGVKKTDKLAACRHDAKRQSHPKICEKPGLGISLVVSR